MGDPATCCAQRRAARTNHSLVGSCLWCSTAHVDHGKSTLADSLLNRAGLLSADKAGTARVLDTDVQEQERGITIAATSVALPFDLPPVAGGKVSEEGDASATTPLLVNLIDSPGHSDFSSEVTAALRLTDGAVVVVDASEGVLAQTETVLRQAISEGVRPVLFVNKVDRLITELKLSAEAAADKILRVVESVNSVVALYAPEKARDFAVSFEAGTVGVGSGYYGWGFTLDTLAATFARAGAYTETQVRDMCAAKGSAARTYKRVRKALVKLGLQVRLVVCLSCVCMNPHLGACLVSACVARHSPCTRS